MINSSKTFPESTVSMFALTHKTVTGVTTVDEFVQIFGNCFYAESLSGFTRFYS